ncbi:hypothetical protein RSSM_00265 [Rhodopirellula sallentina SM41]|uniref:Uncharacterized protein n=1 Tax=Rhodopirellula sallentina SM41 TaxID=1263870 RepID=M5UKB8_9BACT|nr:hypothetical protein RSSM_00265 [Rhodopirellula sallentina SM41]
MIPVLDGRSDGGGKVVEHELDVLEVPDVVRSEVDIGVGEPGVVLGGE